MIDELRELRKKILEEGNEKSFEYLGYKCRIVRIVPGSYLCGYVCIPETSVIYGRACDDDLMFRFAVHGGITFAGKRFDANGWWIRFDCAHCDDMIPRFTFSDEGVYRDMEYVTEELKGLVDQIMKLDK